MSKYLNSHTNYSCGAELYHTSVSQLDDNFRSVAAFTNMV